jgi:putative heme-binding domain-containing protein
VQAHLLSDLDTRTFQGLATTLARLDDRPVDQDGIAAYFLDRLRDERTLIPARIMILRAVPANHPKLKTEQLTDQLRFDVPEYRVEVLRALKDRADAKAAPTVRELAHDANQALAVRAQALLTLTAMNQADVDRLIGLAGGKDATLRQEALRALVQVKLTDGQRGKLETLSTDRDLVARLLGKPAHGDRSPATDTEAWLKRLDGPADPEAGRRVFEHPKLANCSKCHRVDGRGADIGPDLSLVGRTERRSIVESILQPSAVVAPHYQAWRIDTVDGRTFTGQVVHTYLDETHYADAKGDRFMVRATDVAEITAAKGSIMPDGLVDGLTDQEIRDLVAYLASRK